MLPHHAKAVEKAALVQQLFADADGNGVPDVFEGAVGSPGFASGSGGFASVPSANAGVPASVRTTVTVSVNGVVQPDGAIPEEVAKAIAAAGVSVPGVAPRAQPSPSRWVAFAVAVTLGLIVLGVLAALS